jgi:hypothetical protein
MITQKPAASRLPLKAASTAFAALLALGLPLAAQSRGHSSSGGGGRSAHSTGGGSHSSASGGAPHYSGGNSGGNSGGGSSTGGGRTAHEVPGAGGSPAHRQPNGSNGRGGHGGHGGHYGGGYYGGGYYGGYYGYGYPYGYYGGWGFWPGIWGGYGYGYDYPYGYPYGHGYPGASGRYYESNRQGALDLDVAPGRTHVFIDGQDLGPVDRYDGWPGYLWLPQGTYDVAFYLDGYKTVARQLTVYPGTVLDIDDRLEEGQSVRPEDLATKTHQRRDDRLSYERQRRDRISRGYSDDDQDWRDRARRDRDRGAMRNEDRDDDEDQMEDRKVIGSTSRSGAHLRLSVEPEDASIYLDGQFVGTGSDVSLLQAGLPVAPGTHRLAVVRPGHRAVEKEFDVKAGGDIELNIELESGSGR